MIDAINYYKGYYHQLQYTTIYIYNIYHFPALNPEIAQVLRSRCWDRVGGVGGKTWQRYQVGEWGSIWNIRNKYTILG